MWLRNKKTGGLFNTDDVWKNKKYPKLRDFSDIKITDTKVKIEDYEKYEEEYEELLDNAIDCLEKSKLSVIEYTKLRSLISTMNSFMRDVRYEKKKLPYLERAIDNLKKYLKYIDK